jgi:hypothetical protein
MYVWKLGYRSPDSIHTIHELHQEKKIENFQLLNSIVHINIQQSVSEKA